MVKNKYHLKSKIDKLFYHNTVESGIKLIQNYFNSSIAKDKEKKRFLVKVASECRKTLQDS